MSERPSWLSNPIPTVARTSAATPARTRGQINPRTKGATGELEAARVIRSILEPVATHCGCELPSLRRNLTQARAGGYDLEGLEWLALEVKRVEQDGLLEQWWAQTLRQARPGQVPCLMHRKNRHKWSARVRAVVIVPMKPIALDIDLNFEQFSSWLGWEFYGRNAK